MKKLFILALPMMFAVAAKAQSAQAGTTERTGVIESVAADGTSGVLIDSQTNERKYYYTRDGEFHYLTRDGEFHRDAIITPGVTVRFVERAAGSGVVVVVTGNMDTMNGLIR
jgi:hypothetical protein